ncbi:MAG: glycosyltransferase family 39 protein [Anaerolineae bacterium]|nr:glycosyltransferase family 39 protein [Anaerolineae bacterium]
MTTETPPAAGPRPAVHPLTSTTHRPRPTAFLRALGLTWVDAVGLGVLLVAAAGYLFNLGGWLITDDEGSYFYQSWRISLGEVPYRDFLTPQLPLFMGVGGLVQRVFGPDPVPLRVLSVCLVLGAGWAFYRVLRRLTTPSIALVGLAAFLAHPDVYAVGRVYRPEPYMLFFIALGLWAFMRAEERARRRWLVLSGLLFGLGVLTKLFGALALGGLGLYVLLGPGARGQGPGTEDGGRKTEDGGWNRDYGTGNTKYGLRITHYGPFSLQSLIINLQSLVFLGLPAVLVAGGVMGVFLLVVPETWTAVFGHQLMQGSQLSRWDVLVKGIEFYGVYFTQYAPLLVFALPMAVQVWREGGRRTLLAWQLPTLIAFILLSRELWPRHLVYLAPALVGLWALSLEPMLAWTRRGFLLVAVVGAIILPWVFKDNEVAHYSERGTWRIAAFLAAEVGPHGSFLADYPELNFYAQRPTGYAAASLSQGAASSGQITGARLAQELDAMGGTAVALEMSDFSQTRFLRDRAQFLAYLDQNFRPLGIFQRNHQVYQIYRRKGAPAPGPELNFGDQLTLFTGGPYQDSVPSGGSMMVGLRFGVRPPGGLDQRPPLTEDYVAFLHLRDAEGNQWGQGDGALTDSNRKLTSEWVPGELNSDRIRLNVRPGAPPGVYDIMVGVYRRRDLGRLDILNSQGNPVGTEFKLAQLRVTASAAQPKPTDLGLAFPTTADLGAARLVGYSMERGEVEAGDTLRVELGWQGQRDLEGQAALSLVGPGGEVERQTFPLSLGRGEVGLRQVLFPVDADVPGGTYTLHVSLLGGAGAALGTADLGQLTVRPVAATFTRPAIAHPLRVDLGERVDLAGYDLQAETVAPGGTVNLTLYWHPQGRLTQSLKVFTHLVSPDGVIVGQRDNVPVDNTRPTTGWRPGEYIVDRYSIPVPATARAGRYELRVGLYDPLANERLPVQVDGQPAPDGQVVLQTVEVRP